MLRILFICLMYLILGLYLFLPRAFSETFDLLKSFERAKEVDPALASVRAEYKAALTLPKQSRAQFLPQLNFSYNLYKLNYLQAPKTYYDYDGSNLRFNLQQTLLNFPLWVEHQQNKLRAKLAEQKLTVAELNLARRVIEAYFNYVIAKERLRILKEEEKALRHNREAIKRLYQAGEATLTDIYDAETKLSEVIYRLATAEKDLLVARGNMARLLGLDYTSPFDLVFLREDVDLPDFTPDDLNYWLTLASKNNPTIKYYATNKEIAFREINKQSYYAYPKVDAYASYIRSSSVEYLRTQDISYHLIGLQITIPIFTGGYITAKKQEARERFHQAEKEHDRILSDILQHVLELYHNVKTTQAQIQYAKTFLISSQLSLDATRKAYQAGQRTFVDLLFAESNYYQAKYTYLKARYDYLLNLILLKIYCGTLTYQDLHDLNKLFIQEKTYHAAY